MGLGNWIPLYPVEICALEAASAAEPKISEKLIWKISLSSASVNCGVDLEADTADGILATGFDTDDLGGADYFNAHAPISIASIPQMFCNLGDEIVTSPLAI